ncbi:Hint domain-containing protein [Lutimaribacter pacificus]|uniref:Hint domain-containing protein n=1 Tax=Lutimaribacter pacificus TaxID=391948 RepID=A0A1H0AWC0_9RHOB|nr:Hint domain-containing protein [Lutimaribacter pacificus]SDN37363.1 Hint domain-containing protein [Lutimaribacter pacificus]SHJ64348.1 Hint domain-containing protein [Lutimaribacter pacificus]
MKTDTTNATFSLPVYRSDALSVVNGANLGDPLSFADELVPSDVYRLAPQVQMARLSVHPRNDGTLVVAPDTAAGSAGAQLHLDSCLTFMSPDGQTTEMLILVEVDGDGGVTEVYALPLAAMQPRTDYALVTIDRDSTRARLAELACVSFTRGTHITLANGAQKRIEDLRVGDRVLTRDEGPQEIRWIGQNTVRAVGEYAPIVITAGTLHNAHDLIVSPEHRLFIYQRSDALGAGRSELLVRARHLVNGSSVYRQDGGFVDYFQLLFDSHQIIYAEGIAAETLLVDPRTRPALPAELAETLSAGLNAHGHKPHMAYEVQESLLDRPDAAEILRRASTR